MILQPSSNPVTCLRVVLTVFLAVACAALGLNVSAQVVSYTGGILVENFDSMGPTGVMTPNGWFVGSNATPSSVAYTTTVSINDGNIAPQASVRGWNLGPGGAGDRALGTGPTITNRYTEVRIVNNSRASLTSINVLYDGEEWRTGSSA